MKNEIRLGRIILILCISVLVVSFSACNTTSKVNSSVETEKTHSTNNIAFGLHSVDDSDTLFAMLKRGFCFGTCPVYTVKIFQSGYATYIGQANVDKIGEFVGLVSQEQLKHIRDVAVDINYWSFDTLYNEPKIADIPAITTSITLDGMRKTVVRKINFPLSLLRIEDAIDSLVATTIWRQK